MLFKMLGIECAYAQQFAGNPDLAKPRQLFITQSHVLATHVEEDQQGDQGPGREEKAPT